VGDLEGVRLFAGALLAVAALLALAACGGGSPSDTSGASGGTNASAPAITKAALIKKADAICRQTDEVQRKAFNVYSKRHEVVLGDTPKMRKAMTTVLLPPVEVELKEIAALGAPAVDPDLGAIMTGWEKALRESLSNPSLLLGTGVGPFTKPDELAGKYGFKDCENVL
jgi:hypothetical protein